MKPSLLVVAAGALLVGSAASAARVKATKVEASSYYPPEDGVTYMPKNVTDGKLVTSWVEGEEGSGLGSWIKLHVPAGTKLEGIKVWGGLWASYDYWTRAPRPKQLEFKFADGTTETMDLEDKMEAQTFMFKKAHDTSEVRVRIKAIYNGTTWFDAAISEIQLIDVKQPEHVEPKGFQVSSKLPDDGDGNYNPNNVMDGVADSMWCEGSQDGDGKGEWIEVDFGGPKKVSQLSMINGVGGNLSAWKKSNRATRATLTFSDGSTAQVDIKDFFLMQKASFPARQTSKVRITFDEITKGAEYNDLCVSELYFK